MLILLFNIHSTPKKLQTNLAAQALHLTDENVDVRRRSLLPPRAPLRALGLEASHPMPEKCGYPLSQTDDASLPYSHGDTRHRLGRPPGLPYSHPGYHRSSAYQLLSGGSGDRRHLDRSSMARDPVRQLCDVLEEDDDRRSDSDGSTSTLPPPYTR